MYTFWLVITDLFWFVLGKDTPTVAPIVQKALPAKPEQTLIPETEKPIALPAAPLPEPIHTDATLPIPGLLPAEIETNTALLHAPIVMYVCRVEGTPRYTAPQLEFDGMVEVVPYGAAVTVVGYRGRYTSVLRGGHTGWINKDDLSPDKQSVWPQLVVHHEYLATESDTIKLRAIIQDVFGAGSQQLPLQAGEYVLFRLMQDHRTIAWPITRPRLPGTWQNILRGVTGIHSTIMPKTDSIMEWNTEYGEGRLAYVEAVSPDNTIALTLVGLTIGGQYETKTLFEEEWRELRPVFIEVA
jgi:hypothetical protein